MLILQNVKGGFSLPVCNWYFWSESESSQTLIKVKDRTRKRPTKTPLQNAEWTFPFPFSCNSFRDKQHWCSFRKTWKVVFPCEVAIRIFDRWAKVPKSCMRMKIARRKDLYETVSELFSLCCFATFSGDKQRRLSFHKSWKRVCLSHVPFVRIHRAFDIMLTWHDVWVLTFDMPIPQRLYLHGTRCFPHPIWRWTRFWVKNPVKSSQT